MNVINNTAKVAVIGLGKMGLPMAINLVKAGFEVMGYDPTLNAREELVYKGGKASESATEAAEGAEVVITMLPNGAIVREALLGDEGAIKKLKKSAIIIDMSSSAPLDTRRLGEELKSKGYRFVDAPVSGGQKRAIDSTLTIMAGGEEDDVKAVAPIFDAVGGKTFQTGLLGSGHAMKALNNYVSGAGAVAAMEAIILGKEFGLDQNVMVDILNVSTGRNNTTDQKLKQFVLSETWGSGFALDLMAKDIRIAADLSQNLHLTFDNLKEIADQWESAQESLGEGADHTEMYRYLNQYSKK
ncbi:NAD(P)-dependent oxidoreductase (plasmid) [Marinobacter sp. M3C]|jgi:3-hydroxyisobutyrate dehydrogenase|uniref:NAD(P)-dependent oxidoreductase n=1 Tax=Marinobacter sp. M3C TaxID=2917715 RepID=UPI0020105EDE|nr:NAD(P)-dependent oxidoreductase [Marinobacter sp. M3C]UQG62688.1 NAD(P)-dependent oxidoreductase [Marinobacter sp. M3C]